jgi:cytoskeletal protein RodZ
MNTIGETLRRERVRQGLDLQTVSQSTKIGTRLLKAIEAGEFGKLPGGVFTRSFIKQYATALGIDGAYVDDELKEIQLGMAEISNPVPIAGQRHINPISSASASTVSSFVWVLLALAGCGGVYFFMNGSSARQYAKPGEPATPVPASQPQSAKSPETPQTNPSQPIGSGRLQVILSASEASWVSISVDGKVRFSGVLQPNERREVNADEKVKVIAGNAGGVDISLNGKNIEALGPRGQVRTVELTRAGAQVVSRTPKAPLL